MYLHNRGTEYLSSGMTSDASGINTPTHVSSLTSTSLLQALGANAGTLELTSTPDITMTPATPLGMGGLHSSSTTGLAGALGVAGTNAGATAGIGGLAPGETLENSVGQVYAMI